MLIEMRPVTEERLISATKAALI